MSDRDELAQLISDVISSANMQEDIWSDDLADAILARWRLVPVESDLRTMPHEFLCPQCGNLAYVDSIEGSGEDNVTIYILHPDNQSACLVWGDDARQFVSTWPKASA